MTPVTKVNAPEAPSLKISKATAASSLSANTQANLNENNNSFKRMDCTPATAFSSSSKAVSTSLRTSPGPHVGSLSRPFHLPWVLTAEASVRSHPPHHPPDHVTSASGISVTSTTQQPSAMLRPPQHLPDQLTLTSAVPLTLTLEQQAGVTQVYRDGSPGYINSMLDIYRRGTPRGQAYISRARTSDSHAFITSMLDI